ncbi:hypothetical protein [Terrabacter tumescens]|uniref:hypothetical protein n=1 Tax=Terrabacter tumescens TaxID=60443 RepID=UPI0012DDAB4A|nr:hypothetical protein [Terrabacter tumescens]
MAEAVLVDGADRDAALEGELVERLARGHRVGLVRAARVERDALGAGLERQLLEPVAHALDGAVVHERLAVQVGVVIGRHRLHERAHGRDASGLGSQRHLGLGDEPRHADARRRRDEDQRVGAGWLEQGSVGERVERLTHPRTTERQGNCQICNGLRVVVEHGAVDRGRIVVEVHAPPLSGP